MKKKIIEIYLVGSEDKVEAKSQIMQIKVENYKDFERVFQSSVSQYPDKIRLVKKIPRAYESEINLFSEMYENENSWQTFNNERVKKFYDDFIRA